MGNTSKIILAVLAVIVVLGIASLFMGGSPSDDTTNSVFESDTESAYSD